ncbi:MAG: hypothetical protein AB8H86_22320 [Polyangiales bacterium]
MSWGPEITDLSTIARDNGAAVNDFVDACFRQGGIWGAGQSSDGIGELRVYEAVPDSARIAGRIWEIAKQTQHAFWLNLRGEGRIQWTLYAELRGTERQKRHAFDLHTRAQDIAWEHELAGDAAFSDGVLRPRSLRFGHES